MKNNGNNLKCSDYYVGIDAGSNSLGFAATDINYNVLRFKGNAMWGVRLFDEALTAEGRRNARTSRRRLARLKQRLFLLEMLFAEEIAKVDPNFIIRMRESFLHIEDKSDGIGKYSVFNDLHYTDKDFSADFPSMYHLRSKLIHSDEKMDIRLVYLAIHHIIKSRGHFLFDTGTGETERTLSYMLGELKNHLVDQYDTELNITDQSLFEKEMLNNKTGISEKKKRLTKLVAIDKNKDDLLINIQTVVAALAGSTVKLSDLYCDDDLKNAEIKSIVLKNNIDEVYDKLCEILDTKAELIMVMKSVYDIARLQIIKGEYTYISDAKIALYEKNREDLKKLKSYVKENYPEKYKMIFSEKKDKLNNFSAYSGYKLRSGAYTCNQEDFCAFLKSTLPELSKSEKYKDIYTQIENKTFLTKLKGTDNGTIPNQLHKAELEKILENSSKHYDFLNATDEEGISVKDKVLSIFSYKIPYYVGPLNKNSKTGWVVRRDGKESEKIYPWNFENVVDTQQSSKKFMEKLIGRCSYTALPVLPKDSLIYSEFTVLNEINTLAVNGKPITTQAKKLIFENLFVNSCKKVTKKSILECLCSNGLAKKDDNITGVDDVIKSKLKSYHDLKFIFEKTSDKNLIEEIIKMVVVFGDDKRMLRRWLRDNCSMLDDNDFSKICRLKYKDWGRLSEEFLCNTYHTDINGEAYSVMDMLMNTNNNLMQLLSSEYSFANEAEKLRAEVTGGNNSVKSMLDDMYVSPAVRRTIWQTLRIVDEIVDIKKSAPSKIFIEVARGDINEKKERKVSRKDRLIELYKSCKMQSDKLFEMLNAEDENKLRSDKYYLYYAQFGKCMYCGKPIDITKLGENGVYDIDHIYPRSRIKDDSIDNRVLVHSEENRTKSNSYPISQSVRENMKAFWSELKNKGLISEKKYDRLVRNTELTEKELSEFVARQLVETQQSTKALATIIKHLYPKTRIVYSKASNVSEFRQSFDIVKCRDVNDLHHAKDAYLNIVVGNVYDTRFTENFFMNIKNEKYSLNKIFEFDTPGAWDKENSIKTVKKYIEKNNILYTRMPHEVKGQLFDLQIMSATKGQLPIKNGLDIDKYGGYNKVSGSYFCVVEHTDKKGKRIRTIEPVYIYKKQLYESASIEYCKSELGLTDPVIIAKQVRFDALLELDGIRMNITGRTGDSYVYKHAYQLAIDEKHLKYIKNIIKYITRCSEAKKELDISQYDYISQEENAELYDWYLQKLNTRIYSALFKTMATQLNESKSKFENLSLNEQCYVLIEILKAFRCDRQCPDLTKLSGPATAGIVRANKKISGLVSAKLINQSPTGLFETEIDLLK